MTGTHLHGSSRPPTASRALGFLCAAVTVSELGDWLMFIALPLVVLRSSGSALATSTVFLAELIPAVVIGTVCGPIIDRRDPGRLLAVLTTAQALVVLPLLWAGPGRVWLIYLVAAIQAAFTSLATPTQQAIVPTLFGGHEVARVNGLVITAANVARLVGSSVGGALLPILGLHGLVLADIASFVLSGALLVPLMTVTQTTGAAPRTDPVGPLTAIASGMRAVRRDRTLSGALAISFLAAVAQGLFLVLFVLFVLRCLHAGDGLVGLLRGVQAIGGVLGGLLVSTHLRTTSARGLTTGGLLAFAFISALAWNSPQLTTTTWWYVVLFIAVGIPATILSTGLTTATQQASPPERCGRTLSLMSVAQAVGQALGILAAGLLSSAIPLASLLDFQASCYATCAIIAAMTFAASAPRLSARCGAPHPS
jgi:MFS family permease